MNNAGWARERIESILAEAFQNLREEVESEERWADHYFRLWQGKVKEAVLAERKANAKIVHGEIELYEEQAKRVSPARLKKIQRRWHKLKEIENRISQRTGEGTL